MAPFPTAERTLISCVEAQPDLLPAAWREDDSRCLEVDVGCHKGRFLIEMARKFPLSNFLGVERQQKRAQKAQEKISRLGLENAAVVHGDGLEALRRLPERVRITFTFCFRTPGQNAATKHAEWYRRSS